MITSQNPATGKTLKTYKTLTKDAIEKRIARADKAYLSWKELSYAQRGRLFKKLAKELISNKEYYGKIITKEMGKPITQAITEVEKCAWNCEYFAQHTEQLLQPEKVKTEAQESYVRFDPLGIIFFVMPWNFPFWQVLRQAAPTMMSGNTVLLKHASNVPQCAMAIEKAFKKAGFPKDTFQTLLMGTRETDLVLSDFRVKGVSLTGSVGAGSAVASIAGREVKRSVMELGGSDPFIVLQDANVKKAAAVAAQSRLISCGQSCIAAKRFIVVKKVAQQFIDAHVAAVDAMVFGDPMQPETQVGPVSSEKAAAELERQVQASLRKGATLATGTGKAAGAYFPPVVLTDVKPGMPAYEEELFGPVSSIIVVKDEAEAIRVANDTVYGLSSSLWTRSKTRAKKIIPQINAGGVFVNTMTKSDPRMPFGGVNKGGYGRELSSYGIKEFTNVKSVWIEK